MFSMNDQNFYGKHCVHYPNRELILDIEVLSKFISKKKYAYAFATSAVRSGRINVIQVLTPFIGIVNARISSSLSTSLQPQTITDLTCNN